MAISLNGSTGVISGITDLPDAIIDADMLAANAVTTAKINDGAVTAAKRGAGAILQVVQGSTSTQVEVATATFTDTSLSASITPSSSSNKILVIVNQMFQTSKTTAGQGMGIRVLRDSTTIHDPTRDATGAFDHYANNSTGFYGRFAITKLDSPSSTSSLTYKTQGRPYTTADTGKVLFNISAATVNATSYITLIEVAG